jgi:hypothetical protein
LVCEVRYEGKTRDDRGDEEFESVELRATLEGREFEEGGVLKLNS